jgi:hypothetical protein
LARTDIHSKYTLARLPFRNKADGDGIAQGLAKAACPIDRPPLLCA